jgi:ParB-like chromosome segregation protein Spo0J
MPKLRIEYIPTDRLVPYARNARTHSDEQIGQIAASIAEFGFTNPVLIDADDGIVAGHGRVLAAKRLGIENLPAVRLGHLTEAQRRAYIIADNKIAENAGWDDDLLAAELAALRDELAFDLSVIGFSDKELDDILGIGGGAGGDGDDDDSPGGNLSDRFGAPPFSVLNAREGWWQDRKRAWISLGIQSELGRGETAGDKLTMSETVQKLKPSADQALKRSRRKANAEPGGSKMPAADYSKSKARGDGRGRAINRG